METSVSSSFQAGQGNAIICKICQKQFSKYTCPRCNLRYCSLACYKGHSLQCTESFMRENVLEGLHDLHATSEVKEKTLDMLKRLHFDEAGRSILEDESLATCDDAEAEFEGDEGTFFSNRTLQLIAEGRDLTLDELSEEERKAFMRSLAAGEVSHLIQPWNPWWLNPLAKTVSITKQGSRLVQPVHSSDDNHSRQPEISRGDEVEEVELDFSEVPAPPSEPLSPLKKLTQKEPSPLLPVHLSEVIYAYCFTLRYYNGDWRSEPLEATLAFFSVSHVMGQAAVPESVGVAFAEALKTVCSPVFKHAGGFAFGLALFDDCAAVLQLGRACIICALADLRRMLENAKRDLELELVSSKKTEPVGNQESERGSELRVSSTKLKAGPLAVKTSRNTTKIRSGRKNEMMKIEAGLRKLFFMLCWTNEQMDEVFSSLAALVETEKARALETRPSSTLGLVGMNDSKPIKERPLVQEIA
ncbi:zinc finger HIT domain-containing protein 3 [Marchantia polymorpha subsp. ruderalis]|uniref:HIT-type domain-containing protein n=2 Tax=Marchantia polymorpha TaxID=3197 RepID=A0AAF6B2L1_MARPO|nr:hypothetical protein MARPO_0049s0078 [Marchantia polymorpha]BBN06245.1 hypothetical protein Mp_3g19560 [Marchantia polymorpha subsp. ruderalis]|eukprot:PTQ38798.1 hypothetical protein MARPO_0049s0078 [Marchantia polymorpha]